MTDADGVKLLFGPYTVPPLKRGERALRLFRDALVVVTSLTDALIPWPRCRALDTTGGGSGLLVDEELARAVRHESAAALMHWWSASETAVSNWRKALGVWRTDSEGSRRLIQAAAEAGAAAMHERGLTDDECDERSRRARALGLGLYLKTGYQGPWWTPGQLRLLGTVADDLVAARIGRTANTVRQKRCDLGIPNPADRRRTRGRLC
jgi:hypothetical protein